MRHLLLYISKKSRKSNIFKKFFDSIMGSFKEHPNLKIWFVFIHFLFDVKVKHIDVKAN